MAAKKTPRRDETTIDLARAAPEKLYDAAYYTDGCSEDGYTEYGRHEPWLSFFNRAARKIKKTYTPRTVADVGCAFGLLTEALVDLRIDAYGFDVSPYAISQGREDIKDRLMVHSIMDPIPLRAGGRKYDMAICIEVLEHLPPDMTDQAIDNLCACTDRILFSSSPDDFDEPTHFNVLPTEVWLEKFAQRDFHSSTLGEPTKFVAPQARVVERPGAPRRAGLLRRLWANIG